MSDYRVLHDGESVHVYDLEKCLKSIRIRNEHNELLIQSLREKVRSLEENYSKDEEIQKMQKRLNEMNENCNRGFPITKEEKEKVDKWCKEHEEKVHGLTTDESKMKAQGCIGGTYTYHFTPTSIGVLGSISCHCGEKYYFSDDL